MRDRAALHPLLAWGALAVYIALGVLIAAHHEPWRDEADPWLVARDADPVTFVRRASLSGTPALWHLILVPLARGGAPYDAQKALHLAIAAATAALILFRAPFPRVTRVAAVFSYFLAYEYAIVVRSYALVVLLLLLIAMAYRTRRERPYRYAIPIALLANTTTHGTVLAALLGLFFLYDTRLTRWKAAAVMVLGGLIAVAQLAAAPGERATTFVHIQPVAALATFRDAFAPLFGGWIAALVAAAVLVTASLWLRGTLLALLWSCYAALLFIYAFWWIGGIRHAGLLLALTLAVLWMAAHEAPVGRMRTACFAALTASLLLADYATLQVDRADYWFAYSGAKEMAGFLHARGLAENPIAAHSEQATSAIAPYLDRPLWYAGIEEYGTFTMWDKKFDAGVNVRYPVAVQRARTRFAGDPRALMLLNVEVPSPAQEGLELVYATRIPVFAHGDERFWLYRFR